MLSHLPILKNFLNNLVKKYECLEKKLVEQYNSFSDSKLSKIMEKFSYEEFVKNFSKKTQSFTEKINGILKEIDNLQNHLTVADAITRDLEEKILELLQITHKDFTELLTASKKEIDAILMEEQFAIYQSQNPDNPIDFESYKNRLMEEQFATYKHNNPYDSIDFESYKSSNKLYFEDRDAYSKLQILGEACTILEVKRTGYESIEEKKYTIGWEGLKFIKRLKDAISNTDCKKNSYFF